MQTRKIFQSIFFAIAIALALMTRAAHAQTATPDALPGRIVAQSGDAYIAHDPATQTWEIGTDAIRRRMSFSASGYRLLSWKNKLTNREWLTPGGGASAELRVVIEGQILTTASRDFALRDFTTRRNADGSLELRVSLARQSLVAHLHYVAHPGTSVVGKWVELENAGRTTLRNLDALDSISLDLRPSADPLTLHWVQGRIIRWHRVVGRVAIARAPRSRAHDVTRGLG
ncbi:MAG: hypothetical protein HZC40_00890 [Chloroflexi bacterium]|nr:hypothetical protein [Chloroflexota bacterium]